MSGIRFYIRWSDLNRLNRDSEGVYTPLPNGGGCWSLRKKSAASFTSDARNEREPSQPEGQGDG